MTAAETLFRGQQSGGAPAWYRLAIVLFSFFLIAFHIYCGAFGDPTNIVFLPVHLSAALCILFLVKPLGRSWNDPLNAWTAVDIACVIASLLIAVYFLNSIDDYQLRVIELRPVDRTVAIALVVLILEAVRRTVGWTLVLVALFFCVHALYADHFPGVFFAAPVTFDGLLQGLVFGDNAVFGIPISVMAAYIVLFLFFGRLLQSSGVGGFFTRLAFAIFGHRTGGPAKAAAISSALFGTISGSGVSNVLTTGSFTIPMMIRLGYQPAFAGGVETAAAVGGAILPPVMGAVAFMMAEFTGHSYAYIALTATIPALLYYFCIYCTVDFEARKLSLPRLDRSVLPKVKDVMWRQGYLAAPIVVVLVMLVLDYSIAKVALVAALCIVLISFTHPTTWLTPSRILVAVEDTARVTCSLSATCACAGIIIGAIFATGLSFQVTQAALSFTHNNLFVVLLISAVIGLVLGTGLTASAVYITMVASVVPILKAAGINELGAHMFSFYYGVVSDLTPPTALAAVAAAGIARVNPLTTMFSASRLGIAAYIVPLVFVYSPELIFQGGTVTMTVVTLLVTGLGLLALSSATAGYFAAPLGPISRGAMLLAAILLIFPSALFSAVGIAVFAAVALLNARAAGVTAPFAFFKNRLAGAPATASAPAGAGQAAPDKSKMDLIAWLNQHDLGEGEEPPDKRNWLAWGVFLVPLIAFTFMGFRSLHATDPVIWVCAILIVAPVCVFVLISALRQSTQTEVRREKQAALGS